MSSKYLQLTLCKPGNPEEEFNLRFQVCKTKIAEKWFGLLQRTLQRGSSLRDPYRVYGFSNSSKALAETVEILNKSIDTVHSEYPGLIPFHATDSMDYPEMNILHEIFEKIRGSPSTPSDIYRTSSSDFRTAVERFNIEIHTFENLVRGNQKLRARIVCGFTDHLREALAPEDYSHFRMERFFGDLFIAYVQVGKSFIDAYFSKDDGIPAERLKPQRDISGDFIAWLDRDLMVGTDLDIIRKEFDLWWERVGMTEKGFDKKDPMNAYGYIPVANLILPPGITTSPELMKVLSPFSYQKAVCIWGESPTGNITFATL